MYNIAKQSQAFWAMLIYRVGANKTLKIFKKSALKATDQEGDLKRGLEDIKHFSNTVKNNHNFTDPVMGKCDKKSTWNREFTGNARTF